MNNNDLLRYSRQILLPEIDVSGQEKLLNATVLIVGLGGLGSPVALYLASAGIGTLILNDHDEVELSNLQRQIIHRTPSIGKSKSHSAHETLKAINADIRYNIIDKQLNGTELVQQIQQADIVVDCTDNFTSRFQLNHYCYEANTPLVSGAVIRMEGQISSFDFSKPNQACYRCLYQEEGEIEDTCSTTGILAPVAGIIGSMQATEVIKLILGLPSLSGRLQILDAKYMQWREIRLKKQPNCPVCSATI